MGEEVRGRSYSHRHKDQLNQPSQISEMTVFIAKPPSCQVKLRDTLMDNLRPPESTLLFF